MLAQAFKQFSHSFPLREIKKGLSHSISLRQKQKLQRHPGESQGQVPQLLA